MPLLDARARRDAALRAKLASLKLEVASWTTMVAQAPQARGGPAGEAETLRQIFQPHTSQITLVCGGLDAMRCAIAAEMKAAEDTGPLSSDAIVGFERNILAAIQIWDFYRAKLALRIDPSLRDSLALLDDLAWEAYHPARDRAVASGTVTATQVREPPLVFPNASWSPFARSRERAYELDESTGNLTDLGGLDQYLAAMPVPVVGIPWYQLAHLPDAVFIGHEVGHLVEEDLALEEPLRHAVATSLANAPEEHISAWSRRWRSEVFADVYGVLVCGPAYAQALIDVMSGDPAAIASDLQPTPQGWSTYPTRALRALVVCEAVRRLPADAADKKLFFAAGDRLQETWTAAYPQHAMASFVPDVAHVVCALMTKPLAAFATKSQPEGAAVDDVLAFDARRECSARKDAENAFGQRGLKSQDVRTLFASVAHAFHDNSDGFLRSDVQERFRYELDRRRNRAPRGIDVPGFEPASDAARSRAAADGVLARLRRREGEG
jgi:hypothetical protein